MCCNFILNFLEFLVSIDKINLETTISENSKDLFYTIDDDVVGCSFVRCTCCFLVAFADVIKGLSYVEFNFGRLNEQIWCTLNIKEINFKIFC